MCVCVCVCVHQVNGLVTTDGRNRLFTYANTHQCILKYIFGKKKVVIFNERIIETRGAFVLLKSDTCVKIPPQKGEKMFVFLHVFSEQGDEFVASDLLQDVCSPQNHALA